MKGAWVCSRTGVHEDQRVSLFEKQQTTYTLSNVPYALDCMEKRDILPCDELEVSELDFSVWHKFTNSYLRDTIWRVIQRESSFKQHGVTQLL